MTDETGRQADTGRLVRLERAGDDFPFYNGQPAVLSARQWRGILGATLAALVILTVGGPLLSRALGSVIGTRLGIAVLFAGLPLGALARAAPRDWRCLFRRITLRDVLTMAGFAVLNLVVTFTVALLLLPHLHMTVNPIVGVNITGALETLGFLLWTAVQLLGEELLTVLPFLALLTLGFGKLGLGRKRAILMAWAGSSLVFALAHLPTYDWNLLQCLAVVGVARLGLTLAYIRTKSLWVSTGAHILYDWTILGFVALVGAVALPPG